MKFLSYACYLVAGFRYCFFNLIITYQVRNPYMGGVAIKVYFGLKPFDAVKRIFHPRFAVITAHALDDDILLCKNRAVKLLFFYLNARSSTSRSLPFKMLKRALYCKDDENNHN